MSIIRKVETAQVSDDLTFVLSDDTVDRYGDVIEAAGWDPVHAPEAPLQPSDVVNLGFVLNGIEHPAERIRALTAAWCLTRQVLVVTTLVRGREMNYDPADLGETTPGFRPAHLKFFDQIELQSLVEQALECEPVPMGLGMVAGFLA